MTKSPTPYQRSKAISAPAINAKLAYGELLLPFAAASDLGGWSPPVDVREHPAG
jgi:hypothetical protein